MRTRNFIAGIAAVMALTLSVGWVVSGQIISPPSSASTFSGSLAGDVTGTQAATVVGKINGTPLSGLTTGLLKNTTGTGVPTIGVAGTDYLAPSTTTVPQWKKASFLVVANGVSGCANANGCWFITWTDGTTHIVNLAAVLTQGSIQMTPSTTKMWISAFNMYATSLCTGSTGLNIATVGDTVTAAVYGSPAYNVTTASPAFKQIVSPTNATLLLTDDFATVSMNVASGTVDQTAAGCAFTVVMLMSQYQ